MCQVRGGRRQGRVRSVPQAHFDRRSRLPRRPARDFDVQNRVPGRWRRLIAKKDGRFACQETDLAEVEIPQAGWYPIEAIYFQRLGTSCLHMRSGMDEPDWMANSAFGYK